MILVISKNELKYDFHPIFQLWSIWWHNLPRCKSKSHRDYSLWFLQLSHCLQENFYWYYSCNILKKSIHSCKTCLIYYFVLIWFNFHFVYPLQEKRHQLICWMFSDHYQKLEIICVWVYFSSNLAIWSYKPHPPVCQD